jgi:hypothetical protein
MKRIRFDQKNVSEEHLQGLMPTKWALIDRETGEAFLCPCHEIKDKFIILDLEKAATYGYKRAIKGWY